MQTAKFVDECCWHPDSGWSGKFVASYLDMKATLSGFETREGFRGFQNGNIELTLASGQSATLLECRHSSSGSISTHTKNLAFIEVLPNYLMMGDRRWTDNDLVDSLEFCLPDARASLSYGDHRETSFETDEGKSVFVSKTRLSRIEVGRLAFPEYEIRLSVERSLSRASKDEVGPDPIWFFVKFAKPCPIRETLQLPFHISTFFELSVGRSLNPRGVVVRAHRDEPLSLNDVHVVFRRGILTPLAG